MIGAVFFLKILAAKTYRTPRGLHQTCRWLGSSDELAFCSVRRFAFSGRIPDLGLCFFARRSSHRGVHRRAKRPNAW
jgi:hypothetical protein